MTGILSSTSMRTISQSDKIGSVNDKAAGLPECRSSKEWPADTARSTVGRRRWRVTATGGDAATLSLARARPPWLVFPAGGEGESMTIRIERDPPGNDFSLLLREYAASLSFDLSFQDFAQELESLPGPYAPPEGTRLLAYVDDAPAGCVAVRRFDAQVAELKRLYVRPAHRGFGLGRRLGEEALATGRTLGYSRIRLDTTPEMGAAQALYRSLGFREIDAYRRNPVAGTRYYELELAPAR